MEKKKIYLVGDDKLEYLAEIGNSKITLNHSNGEQWTEHTKNQRIGSIKDNGNGIKLKLGDINMYLYYDTFANLYTLMNLKVNSDTNLMTELEYLGKSQLKGKTL